MSRQTRAPAQTYLLPAAWETTVNGWIGWPAAGSKSRHTIDLRRSQVRFIARTTRTRHPRNVTEDHLVQLCGAHNAHPPAPIRLGGIPREQKPPRGTGTARTPKHCHDRKIVCRRRFRDPGGDGSSRYGRMSGTAREQCEQPRLVHRGVIDGLRAVGAYGDSDELCSLRNSQAVEVPSLHHINDVVRCLSRRFPRAHRTRFILEGLV
jgi:hypothetical protein